MAKAAAAAKKPAAKKYDVWFSGPSSDHRRTRRATNVSSEVADAYIEEHAPVTPGSFEKAPASK